MFGASPLLENSQIIMYSVLAINISTTFREEFAEFRYIYNKMINKALVKLSYSHVELMPNKNNYYKIS